MEERKYTDDQLKQVIFLRESYLNDLNLQYGQYKGLISKITFLFGFCVSIITLYGTYANQANFTMKMLALILLGSCLIVLCFAFKNRKFKSPARLNTEIKKSNYFEKIYQEVSNIELTCIENDEPLSKMAKSVRWSIYIFSAGMILVMLSFILNYSLPFILLSISKLHGR
jgi:hypothetical protein